MNIADNFLLNEILLRRKNKLILGSSVYPSLDYKEYISTILKNIEKLGYTLSKNVVDLLCTYNIQELQNFYLNLIPILKKLVGANVTYNPMYPNFPMSIMSREESELYFNAIAHYWSNGNLYPNEQKDERLPLFDIDKVKMIDLGNISDIYNIFNNLCTSKTSLSNIDKEDISQIFKNVDISLPNEIPLKENVAFILKIYIENHQEIFNILNSECYSVPNLNSFNKISKFIKTATDVLRLITAMSNGDISLASNTKYRNFKRKERKLILLLLNNCNNIEEDMKRYKNKWIRIGEKLHPFEYKQFDKVVKAFDKLRNNIKIETFNSKVEAFIANKKYKDLVNILKDRPGEFARKLDFLLRNIDDKQLIVDIFKTIANQISTPVLWQVKNHFEHRNENLKYRVFFPKGNMAKSYYIDNTLKEIENKYCNMIVLICKNALMSKYQGRSLLGNVYISEKLKNYIIPFSQRSASKALKTITKGSRVSLDEQVTTLRAFIWWTNTFNKDVIDLDLSAVMFDEKWQYLTHISYTNLKSDLYKSYHSGDITNGGDPNGVGVSEFIDIDIKSNIDNGVRYVVYQVYSFNGNNFNELPNAMFGWMNRRDCNSGEIYEPKTVEQKMDLTMKSASCVPVIFDLVKKEFIWCDISLPLENYLYYNNKYCLYNVESQLNNVIATCYSIVNMNKPNLYDLFELNAIVRGIKVDNKESANIIFDVENNIEKTHMEKNSIEETNIEENDFKNKTIITPFDIDIIVSEYL